MNPETTGPGVICLTHDQPHGACVHSAVAARGECRVPEGACNCGHDFPSDSTNWHRRSCPAHAAAEARQAEYFARAEAEGRLVRRRIDVRKPTDSPATAPLGGS